jgi:hypothetical protein
MEVQPVAVGAEETILGHVIMRAIIFALIGVVFHGPHGRGLHT